MTSEQIALNRRSFLKFAGAAAVSSTGMLTGCATTATNSRSTADAVDVHHHYFAPELIGEIKQHGKALGGIEHFPPKQAKDNPYRIQFPKGRPFAPDPRMAEVPNRLGAMTKGHVGIAMLEVHTASVGYELDGPHGETWSNLYNEAIMNLVKGQPDRFSGIATVPLQDPPRAAKGLQHAIVDLKMSGVTIASNVVGKYYNDKSFDPFWAKAQELDVLMIMHPEWVAGAEKWSRIACATSRQAGFRRVEAVGLPIVYVEDRPIERLPNSLLIMPPHSLPYTKHSWREREYVDLIVQLRKQFSCVVTCVNRYCVDSGVWTEALRQRGIP